MKLTAALIVAYAVCVALAAWFVPSREAFLLYGLPTWCGGYPLALIVARVRPRLAKPREGS